MPAEDDPPKTARTELQQPGNDESITHGKGEHWTLSEAVCSSIKEAKKHEADNTSTSVL